MDSIPLHELRSHISLTEVQHVRLSGVHVTLDRSRENAGCTQLEAQNTPVRVSKSYYEGHSTTLVYNVKRIHSDSHMHEYSSDKPIPYVTGYSRTLEFLAVTAYSTRLPNKRNCWLSGREAISWAYKSYSGKWRISSQNRWCQMMTVDLFKNWLQNGPIRVRTTFDSDLLSVWSGF